LTGPAKLPYGRLMAYGIDVTVFVEDKAGDQGAPQ
jgi:hypothetical protein